MRLVFDVIESIRATIPITRVAGIAFDLVQHGVNPCGGAIAFVLLNEIVRGVPFAGEREFDGLKQFVVGCGHDFFLTPIRSIRKAREMAEEVVGDFADCGIAAAPYSSSPC